MDFDIVLQQYRTMVIIIHQLAVVIMKKSPKKTTPPSPKKPIQNPFNPAKSPQVQRIIAIRDNFRKTIETPIQNIQSIQHSKTPQRCLIHNTILTLYCEIDRKVLCANCMYQQETHRKHRVIPVSRATSLVKEDITAFQIKLEGNMKQCSTISEKFQEIIIKSQRLYPSIVEQLRKYYTNMILMIKQKQKQQINQILEQHQKIKKQILFFDQEVKRINGVINNKLKPCKKPETEDSLLTKRGILEILTKVNKIINTDITEVFQVFDDQESRTLIDFGLYNDIYQMVKNRLIVILPGISVQTRRLSSSPSNPQKIKTTQDFHKSPHKTPPQKPRSISNKKHHKQVTFNLG